LGERGRREKMQRKLVIVVLLTMLFINILVVGLKVSPVSAAPVVDGVITLGEYAGGMAVQLTGQWDTNWTVDTYIWWDTQYLYVAVNEPVPGPTTGRVSWIEFCIDVGPTRAYLDCFCFFDDGSLQYCGYPKPFGRWGWYPSPFPWLAVTNTATEFQVKYTDYGVAFGDTIKMAIDRNLGPPPPNPLGKSAYWPGHEEIVFPTPDVAKWGDVTLDNAVEHIVDGTITPGEYAGGMAVQLLGPYPSGAPFPQWTTNAYISWDTEYFYVAVNESVPPVGPNGPLHSWIEFQFDAPGGYDPPAYHSFVLWDDRSLQYVHYPKPGGPWHWDGPVPSGTGGTALFPYRWWAVTETATEFKVKYTDFGIALGDTIKMSIDRGKNDLSYFPYGECAVWPNPCIFYPTADSTTWGNITLGPESPPSPDQHVVDGLISSGEYDDGMTVQLIGRTDPSWTETAYIDWSAEYLYVAVNESVPATIGHISWIEFAIDAGPARSQLDAFALFDDHVQSHIVYPKPGGPWTGTDPGGFLAASRTATEFRIKLSDFGISLGDTIKMSIDRNHGPAPPPPYGFAAYWPQGAVVYDGTPPADPPTWSNVTLRSLGLDFALVDHSPSKPFEYCKTFEVEVYASNISGNLTDYNLTVAYDSSLIKFLDVGYWGVLAAGHVDNANAGIIQIWSDGGGQSYSGPRGLLFALTFHVEFNNDIDHIWRTDAPHVLNAKVSIRNDVGGFSFVNGSVPITGITIPTPLAITIHLIRGDVDCNGVVGVLDLRAVAAYYDRDITDSEWPNISKYDVKMDNIINIFDLVQVATNFPRG
jgi:hypothetical protein